MEIRYGLTLVDFLNIVVGKVDGPIPFKDIDPLENINAGTTNPTLAKKVLQIFFVSSDGSCCLPLGFKPSTGIKAEELAEIFGGLIGQFEEHGVNISWGSTDGLSSNVAFEKLMKAIKPDYIHIFDVSHIEKNLRSFLERMVFITPDCPDGLRIFLLLFLFFFLFKKKKEKKRIFDENLV